MNNAVCWDVTSRSRVHVLKFTCCLRHQYYVTYPASLMRRKLVIFKAVRTSDHTRKLVFNSVQIRFTCMHSLRDMQNVNARKREIVRVCSHVSSPTLLRWFRLTLILRRSRTGTVRFYTSTSNKRAARPKLYTKSLTRDLKLMYSRLTLVRISINL